MFSLRLILAAGSLSTLISGIPIPSFPSEELTSTPLLQERSSTYITTYGGTGDVTDGWPALSAWVSSLDDMFTANDAVIKASCTQFSVSNPSDSEIASMKTAINSVSSSTGVDARFIFAILMQESNGCVRAPTTNYGVRNPGLMQSHDGTGTCNDGTVQNPCPDAEIKQQIMDGVAGTAAGDGLKQCIAETGASDVSMYYKAARIYNSGSIDSSKNLGAGIATHCYSSDIANRLTGWSSGPSSCNAGTVASLTGTVVAAAAADTSSIAAVVPAASVSAAPVAASSAAATPAGGIFAETGDSSSGAKAVATPAPTVPETVTTSTPVEPVATVSVSPIPVADPSPVVSSAPVASSAAASTTTTSTGTGTQTPGSTCTTEGMWNCIDGTSFQQCGSGTWSVVNQLAAGTACTVGQTSAIDIHAIVTKRIVREWLPSSEN